MSPRARYFAAAEEFRAWLLVHHATRDELLVGFHKRATGRASMTWPESVDEALCFGWIDGKRQRVDEVRYTIRFTPRRPGSTWSLINVNRVPELVRLGRMHPAGVAAFEARVTTGVYSYEERRQVHLTPEFERQFRHVADAWQWFGGQPPSYRRTAVFWVMSAKRDDTRSRRLATLIRDSAAGVRIGPLRRP